MTHPSPATRHPARRGRRGQTLLELMVALTVMGVLASMTVPTYRRAVEQTKLDVAAANLREIWAAQRLLYLENRSYSADYGVLSGAGAPIFAQPALDPWYQYQISVGGSGFVASATRVNSTEFGGSMAIDQTGTLSGEIYDSSGRILHAGYQ